MAIVANTFTSFDAKGIREELSDVINSISPETVPFQSNVGSKNVSNTYFEWQTDSLASVDKTAELMGMTCLHSTLLRRLPELVTTHRSYAEL